MVGDLRAVVKGDLGALVMGDLGAMVMSAWKMKGREIRINVA